MEYKTKQSGEVGVKPTPLVANQPFSAIQRDGYLTDISGSSLYVFELLANYNRCNSFAFAPE